VSAPSPSRQYYWDAQQRGGGCAALSCKSDDTFALAARLRADGWHMSAPIEFSRPVTLEDGSTPDATFRVTALDEAPGARYFVCEHRTPELLWRPEWTWHANGAQAIEAMFLVVTPALVDAAGRAYAGLTGGELVQEAEDCSRVMVDGAELVITTCRALARVTGAPELQRDSPGYAAIRLRTVSLDAACATWRANGVPAVELASGDWLVPAQAASGVALIFRQAD
jgi:hypothetical protein